MRDFLKNYATPLVVAGFFAIAGTGLMMFFGLAREPVHELHQWIGVIFVIFAALHIAWNWRSLTMRLRQSRAVSVIVVLTVLTAGLVGYKQVQGARRRRPYRSARGAGNALARVACHAGSGAGPDGG